MSECYYILKNTRMIKSSKKEEIGDLKDGDRIVAIDTSWPILSNGKDCEGPFFDLKSLVNNSKIYKELKKNNQKRANKIIQKEFINKAEDYMLIPKGREFNPELVKGFVHTTLGNFDNDNVTGVHFFDESKVKIIEIIKTNKNGVWRAKIEVFDTYKKVWRLKEKPSDFFPKEWNKSDILDELYFANHNMKLKIGSEKIYEAVTKSGIDVVFIIENEKIKTIYPIVK